MPLEVQRIRPLFPSLDVCDNGRPRIYFDNPGGTQVPVHVMDRTTEYFSTMNANGGGPFVTSAQSDDLLEQAHLAMADFLNAPDDGEIVFGQNMTSLTFSISRSLGRQMSRGDEIIVTRMDHDANISPWLLLAEDLGLVIRWLDFDPGSCQYNLDDLDELLSGRTRLIAVNYASNALGTINDISSITRRAHAVNALVYVDAVQFCPHSITDVQALDCDFLCCSAYKFCGPHQGILWGRRSLLESLTPYKVRPASDDLPFRFETGTLSHESMAGTLGVVEYLEWIGREMGSDPTGYTRRSERSDVLASAMAAIGEYEHRLGGRFLRGLRSIRGLRVYGPEDTETRVPTFAMTIDGHSPRELAGRLGKENIFSWDGDYYASEVIKRLNLDTTGGMLRLGLTHYNTDAEVDRVLDVLDGI
jgi:cysteine desulfurase family protein (TIGR01976 family)